ncbi:hypothetical protein KC669_03470 [Candidatus Dojkabacteria bacterium]|uniref:Uncharacterized protein n=1 Tax=Candidatus Dojkabacteria bacterium TaxID=2099670 RepID=A0A955LAR3_9BACT|nr:hypothetical protein [Candidatus Dojkabacteria bacterium]
MEDSSLIDAFNKVSDDINPYEFEIHTAAPTYNGMAGKQVEEFLENIQIPQTIVGSLLMGFQMNYLDTLAKNDSSEVKIEVLETFGPYAVRYKNRSGRELNNNALIQIIDTYFAKDF